MSNYRYWLGGALMMMFLGVISPIRKGSIDIGF